MATFATVDDYIAAQPPEIAQRLTAIRELFHRVLPDTQESIRYDMPAFTVGDGYLYMAGYKKHIGMYPMYGIPELDDEMQSYRGTGTKDSMHLRHSAPLPVDLIERIIRAKAG